MEKNQMKKGRSGILTLSVVIWLLLSWLFVYAALHGEKFMVTQNGTTIITFFLLPFLLMGALYGYLISMISFLFSFIITLIFSTTSAYNMVIYLVAALCFSLFSQYFFFVTWKKTAIAASVTTLLTSVAEYACLTLIGQKQYTLAGMTDFGTFFLKDILSVAFISVLLHVFFSKAPDIAKLVFPLGIGYTCKYQKDDSAQRYLRKTRLSVKITGIIIGLELVLGISVAVFMMVLFPDLKDMFARGLERRDLPPGETMTWRQDIDRDSSESDSGSESDTETMITEINAIDYQLDDAALSFDLKMIILMLCVGVPIAAIANFYTKLTIGGPIGHISDFMYEYANADDDKKLEVGLEVDKLKVRTHDEIEVLNESLKSTVHSVADYIGRLKEEQELEKELEVAQKASEAKSSFLSNMSHEIRTPINAVLGMNEMILRESGDEQILEYANNVKSAGNSLLGIINDILDFSKIEAGKMDILPVQYHLGSTINDLINMVAVKAEDKGLKLELNIDKDLPSELIGDEIRIKQCATNVLTNAVKYTEEGTVTLNVTFRKVDDINIMLRFQVVDTGIGIKEEDLNKLYSPFERIEEIRNRSVEGTGLGMSIVKKLLALMNSRLEVKSVYGEGSDFSFEVKQQVISWEPLGDFKEKYREYLKSLDKYHEKFWAPEAEILVVDDTVINLTVVKGLLKSTKIKVDTAESGFETLDKVKEKHYDAIFIDHRMPEMDGVETLQRMKTLEGNLCEDVPIIALTANAGERARDEYLAAGFDDYLSKPVNGEILEDMLKKYLPKEKVLEAEGAGDGAGDSASMGRNAGSEAGSDSLEKTLGLIEGIDYKEAVKNCGSVEVLADVVKEFAISILSKADNIEKFAAGKDFRNYTVAVHALKSSARLIGALKLSGDAAYLEQCGNDENEAEIEEKTPHLLSLYRSYREKLAPVAGDTMSADSDLPEIPSDELLQAFSDMKELLEAYDFDTADGIMKMLSEYSIPSDYREKYAKIRELMAAVDRDKLLEVL